MKIKKAIIRFFLGLVISYTLVCLLVYFFQEKLIFFPEKVELNYEYNFEAPFNEYQIPVEDGTLLNVVHFKADSSRGAILHFHGNAGSIKSWGSRALNYLEMGYDFFIYDYRGFGKSEGNIASESQLITDAERIFEFVETFYPSNEIIIEGFSIGTGIAIQTAANHAIKRLLLLAPYQSLKSLMHDKYPILPGFLLKYPLQSDVYLSAVRAPITIFHGSADALIPSSNSQELAKQFKANDKMIIVKDLDHNNLPNCNEYLAYLRSILKP